MAFLFHHRRPLYVSAWSFVSKHRCNHSISVRDHVTITPGKVAQLDITQGGRITLDLTGVIVSNISIDSAWQDCVHISSNLSGITAAVDIENNDCNLSSSDSEVNINVTIPELFSVSILSQNVLNLSMNRKVCIHIRHR